MPDSEEPPGGEKKHPESIIYISNLSEDVWPFISAISDPVARQAEIEENASLSDRDLFALAGENHVLFISPRRVSEDFAAYYKELFGIKNFNTIATRQHSGEICRDILSEETILTAIENTANSSRKVTMISYTTSFQFLHLVDKLRSRGIAVVTPESPDEENAWTVNFYGSKSGIRQLAGSSSAKEPDFVMPQGLICVSRVDAARIAANKYVKNQGVVLKTNKGHSGAGLLIFRPGDLPLNYHQCEQKILEFLKKDAYWDLFPIIIEDYVAVNPAIGGGFPNVEFKILRNGHIEFLYYCSLRVTPEGVFKGVEVHNDVIPERIAVQLVDTGFYVAEQYNAAGYRGYFDIDFIAGKNGKLYVTESNVRRTGGTHVYQVAAALFGQDFMYETYILSNNLYNMPAGASTTFAAIQACLKPILFDKKSKEGVVIASENVLARGQLAYIIFGKTRKRAIEIEAQMQQLLIY